MTAEMVAQVRRFNRTVTARIGVLNDNFLASERSLGQNRLLWEIGAGGRDIRSLREGLSLDSGYLSRLLRTLEGDGLIVVEPSPGDGRVRAARLTAAGRREVETLDRLLRRKRPSRLVDRQTGDFQRPKQDFEGGFVVIASIRHG